MNPFKTHGYLHIFLVLLSLASIKCVTSYIYPQFRNGIELICKDIKVDVNTGYCDYVNSGTARAYYKDNFSVYSPGTPMPREEQNLYASFYSEYLRGGSRKSPKQCSEFLKYLSCGSVFPQCAVETLNVEASNNPAYYEPCKLQCDLVNHYCQFDVPIDCSGYLDTDCSLQTPRGMFALQGGWKIYDKLALFYLIVVCVWVVFGYGLWSVVLCRHVNSLALSELLRWLPLFKVFVLLSCVAFWRGCEIWMICSVWKAAVAGSLQLLYSTIVMYYFFLIALGFSILQPVVAEGDRKLFLPLLGGFYIINNILVLSKDSISLQAFWITSGIAYGGCYLFILWRTINVVALFQLEVSKLETAHARANTGVVTPAEEELVQGAEDRDEIEDGRTPGLNPIVLLGYSPLDRYYRYVLAGARVLHRWVAVLCFRSESLYRHLYPEASSNIKEATLYQFYLRRDMYIAFLVLVLANIATEMWAYSLEKPDVNSDFPTIIITYEVTHLITILFILYVFRPNVMSPLFYAMPVKYFTHYNQGTHILSLLGLGGVSARTPGESAEAIPAHYWRDPGAEEQVRSIRHPVTTVEVVGVREAGRVNHSNDPLHSFPSVELTPLLDATETRAGTGISGGVDGDVELGHSGVGTVEPQANSRSVTMLAVVQQPNKDIFIGYGCNNAI